MATNHEVPERETTMEMAQRNKNVNTAILGPGDQKWCCFFTTRRYLVAFMAFLGFFNVYALRVNLSVAIVAMTSPVETFLPNGTTIKTDAAFDWDSEQRGIILSAFFYGYAITQLPAGYLASRIGGVRLFTVGVGVTSALALLTPLFVREGTEGFILIFIRVVQGLFEGVTYPCIHAIWSRWAPASERSRLATIAFSGSYVGTVVSLPFCGFLAQYAGWHSVFYVTGAAGLLWAFFWSRMVSETPMGDAAMSQAERDYLAVTVPASRSGAAARMPWIDALTSAPVWAIVAAHFSENWGFYTLLTQLPTFMSDTLGVKLSNAGILSSLPYLAMSITLQLAGHLADWLRDGRMSTTAVRKLMNCGAFLSQTAFMLWATYSTTTTGVMFGLIVAVGLGGFAWSAFSVNHLDIAPQHAAVLMGLSNTFATLPGMISPHLAGLIVRHKSAEEWHIVFYISSGIYLAGALLYGFLASGERQAWAIDCDPNDVKLSDSDEPATETTRTANPATTVATTANAIAAAATSMGHDNPAVEIGQNE